MSSTSSEYNAEPLQREPIVQRPRPPPEALTKGRANLRKWLGKTFRVVITDGRVLTGFFNCTDKDANVVLSMCTEYLEEGKDARVLGNVMIPGKHIVSISVDMPVDPPMTSQELTQ
ncbi:N-alpha-acetyltransferase 38, NatC auxiliary subunit [Episyrphus balteatus]|uniref:N-alpha-acetyltransferase 38, NatC auxiliary subunit n=1 Tax=Episyrphus balteatus TaxID=286459 RepID=UPI0024867FD2|nr:N-alpha-acetyltransferase 38, NatC auxiliary subunit [Episyrphus balteatus]